MEAKHVKDLMEAYASVYAQPEETIGEESVEPGQDPHKINTAKAKQVTAPKGVGVPSKEKGYVPLKDSADLFDIIKGYLLDEGYADTEQAAEAIMVNMSEDWRESIVEEVLNESDNYDKNRKRAAKRAAARNAARSAGKTGAVPGVGYVTPEKERETYTDSTGVERHTSGARMPKK